jgi:TatA/E family protein of Tat protein translocase
LFTPIAFRSILAYYLKEMPIIRNVGAVELIIILVVLLVFFGSKKITELARNAGEASKEIKRVKKEFDEAVHEVNSDVSTSEQDDDNS